MPKFYDLPDSEISLGKVTRIKEDKWFQIQQKLLLWIANNKEGRALLCIKEDFPYIVKIRKNCIRGLIDFKKNKPQFFSEYRVGAKYANIIRYRWKAFQEMAQWYYMNEMAGRMIFSPVAATEYVYTHTTYFPDPDIESTTVDGRAHKDDSSDWPTTRNAADGQTAADDIGVGGIPSGSGVEATLYRNFRAFVLFNTADIGDTDTLDSATLSGFVRGGNPDTQSDPVYAVTTSPASNTAITTADYDQVSGISRGSVAFGSIDTYHDISLTGTLTDYIDRAGVTKLGFRGDYDFNNTTPTAALNLMSMNAAETAGTSQDPKLVVTHTAIAGGDNLLLMGVS